MAPRKPAKKKPATRVTTTKKAVRKAPAKKPIAAKASPKLAAAPKAAPREHIEIEAVDLRDMSKRIKSYTQKNPGAVLVGGIAIITALLLLLP